jgi:hypothetical protein
MILAVQDAILMLMTKQSRRRNQLMDLRITDAGISMSKRRRERSSKDEMLKLSTAISCLETTLMELVSKMLNLSIYL